MDSDAELLRRYCDKGDQQAFAEFVRRHLDLVYSAAAYHARSRADADEISQQVFIAVAKKARSLSQRTDVVGWLYSAARYEARDKVRSEMRRNARERTYAVEESMNGGPESNQPFEAPELREYVLGALAGLKPLDRSALLLRYWENRTWEEIGKGLSLSAEGARKRGERALDFLRHRLVQRGVASRGAAIASILADSLVAAPSGVASGIAATAAAAGLAGSASTGSGVVALMATSKTGVGVVVVAVVASLGVALYERAEARSTALALATATRHEQVAEEALGIAKARARDLRRRSESLRSSASPRSAAPTHEQARRQERLADELRADPHVVAMAAEEQRRYLASADRPFISAQHLNPGQAAALLDAVASRASPRVMGFPVGIADDTLSGPAEQALETALGSEGMEALAAFEAASLPARSLVNSTLGTMLAVDPSIAAQATAVGSALEGALAERRATAGANETDVADFGAKTAEILASAAPRINAILTPDQQRTFRLAYTATTGRAMPPP